MEHPHTYGAKLTLNEGALSHLGRPYFEFSARNDARFKGLLKLTYQCQRQHALTNIDFTFYRERFPETPSAAAAIRLYQAVQRRMLPEQPLAIS